MNRKTTITAAALVGSTMLTSPAQADRLTDAERASIQESVMASLRDLGYEPGQFDRIVIRVDDDEIDVEADGRRIDADLTYARSGAVLGRLIDGDIDDDEGDRDLVYTSAGWTADDEDDEDDERDDEDDERDDEDDEDDENDERDDENDERDDEDDDDEDDDEDDEDDRDEDEDDEDEDDDEDDDDDE